MIKKDWNSLLLLGKLFFYSCLLPACSNQQRDSKKDISIFWKDGKARGIYVPMELMHDVPADSITSNLEIRLAKHGDQPFLHGAHSVADHHYLFQPLIPFTRGLTYEVFIRHKLFYTLEIPKDSITPKLIAIHPQVDTVPENLLKIYLKFSEPMSEGHALQHIKMVNENGDSLPGTFLNLQNELWNEDGTELTLWLDPGRIKRGLIPNEKSGTPLVRGEKYQLIISPDLQSASGNNLEKSYTKKIVAIERDSVSPDPQKWKLVVPEKNSEQALEIYFGEPLDYALVQHAIQIENANGSTIIGKTEIDDEQKIARFTPVSAWYPGEYKILIEGRLEDLAGNNLNRLFDVDLKKASNSHQPKKVFERIWRIK